MTPKHLILRILLIMEVALALLVWPEAVSPLAFFAGVLLAVALASFSSANFCATFATSFLVATAMALCIFGLLNPAGLFDTAWQDPLATDSQFFLHEARRLLSDSDLSALFSTWGSLVPVFYGAVALKFFSGSYLGIVFFNCLIYSISIFLAARLLDIPNHWHRLLPLLGLLPLQGFYNAMLAKEPLYLFLVIGALYSFGKAMTPGRIQWPYLLPLMGAMATLIIFRPTGAILLFIIALVNVMTRFGLARASALAMVVISLSAVTIGLANYMDYYLPLFFIGNEGSIDLSSHGDLLSERIATKSIPDSLVPLFSPPWSIILSPLLSLLWMISPIPLMGQLMAAFSNLLQGNLSFGDLALATRYLDSLIIILLVFYLFGKKITRSLLFQPLVLFGLLQIISIVALQFFESGRHRYLPGFILALTVTLFMTRRNKKTPSKWHQSHRADIQKGLQ